LHGPFTKPDVNVSRLYYIVNNAIAERIR